jgi:hypothetical protein
MTLLSAVSRLTLLTWHIPTAMSDSKSLNTAFREVMLSSKHELVFIHDMSDITLQIIFNDWWASMNITSKCAIA